MANDRYRELANDISQGGNIQHVFSDAVERARRPTAIPMATQIQRIDMKILAERSSDPIPVAGVIQTAVYQQKWWFTVAAPIPELQFEAVRVKEVGDWFQANMVTF